MYINERKSPLFLDRICPICFNDVQSEYGGRIAFQSFNVGEPDGRLAMQSYCVRGHPTIVIVDSRGDVFWNQVAVIPRSDLVTAIEDAIGP